MCVYCLNKHKVPVKIQQKLRYHLPSERSSGCLGYEVVSKEPHAFLEKSGITIIKIHSTSVN